MATSGTIDVNLTAFGESINSGTGLASAVVGGVRDQGTLIGLAIGLTIAIGLLFGLIFLVLSVVPKLIGKMKGLKRA